MTDVAFPLSLMPPLAPGVFPEQDTARSNFNAWVQERTRAVELVLGVLGDRLGSITVEELIDEVLIAHPDVPEHIVEDVIYEDLRGSVIRIMSDGLIVADDRLRRGA